MVEKLSLAQASLYHPVERIFFNCTWTPHVLSTHSHPAPLKIPVSTHQSNETTLSTKTSPVSRSRPSMSDYVRHARQIDR